MHSDPLSAEWSALTPEGQRKVKVLQWAPLPDQAEPLAILMNSINRILGNNGDDDDDD